jgi:hypothetical protein
MKAGPTRRRQVRALALAAGLAAVVAGCGSNSAPPDETDAGALFSCAGETRAVQYMAGLTRTSVSGGYQAVLVESVPGPPIKGQNAWTVQIFDGSGAPQDGLTVTATPTMPDHVHPTGVKPVVTPKNDGTGTYEVAPVYLFMAGYWEVRLTLQPQSRPKDTVVFPLCIDG